MQKNIARFKKRGFTLVEIMIVVAIVALLASIAIPTMLQARRSANETAARATLKSFVTACETYSAANATIYPSSIADLISGPNSYFPYDLSAFNDQNNHRQGYYYLIEWPSYGGNAYTVTARAISNNAGNWDFRAIAGASFERTPRGQDTWESF